MGWGGGSRVGHRLGRRDWGREGERGEQDELGDAKAGEEFFLVSGVVFFRSLWFIDKLLHTKYYWRFVGKHLLRIGVCTASSIWLIHTYISSIHTTYIFCLSTTLWPSS